MFDPDAFYVLMEWFLFPTISDKLNEIAPKKTFKCIAVCNKCSKRFAKYSNLKRHVTKFHLGIV